MYDKGGASQLKVVVAAERDYDGRELRNEKCFQVGVFDVSGRDHKQFVWDV